MTKKTEHTPLIAQFLEIKQQYPDAMLFFQVGDFYELFFDDAVIAAQFLAITLTKRGKANGKDIPLCGVPVHALGHYLTKLVKGGFTVALCDQLSKPQPGTVVKRAVTKVYTPGTLTDAQLLDATSASYLCAIAPVGTAWGLCFVELLTAHVVATTVSSDDPRTRDAELARFMPDEIVLPAAGAESLAAALKKQGYTVSYLREHADQAPLSAEQLLADPLETEWGVVPDEPALHGVVQLAYRFLRHTNPPSLTQITAVSVYEPTAYVTLDAATQTNLSLVRSPEGTTAHTLFSAVNATQTAMGARHLKKWLVRPLREKVAISRRQEVVSALCNDVTVLMQLREQLRSIADVERIVGRIALHRAMVADYHTLRATLQQLEPLKKVLEVHKSVPLVETILTRLPTFDELVSVLQHSLHDDEAGQGIIKPGFNEKLDELRELAHNGQSKIQELAVREAATHDISSLKILYTSVAGYFLEVTKTHVHKVPEHYRQVQTLANRSRYITTELKELEQMLSSAQEQCSEVEKELYAQVEEYVRGFVPRLRRAASALATLDALFSFAYTAYTHSYVMPTFNTSGQLHITQGRHPVVEQSASGSFVANDTQLGCPETLWIITGPNMGGKSTYLRQVALISVLAQCGSGVPVRKADVMLVDRIFTRIGAGDNVAQGKSTFLVEMEETATICAQATKNSLVILDEVGRGTSTQDGRALAQAIIEYLAGQVGARTLFATHYHELTALASHDAIANYHVECQKKGETLHFLHTLAPGVATASFGIDVAKLAHLPEAVIARARELLRDGEGMELSSVAPGNIFRDVSAKAVAKADPQSDAILEELKNIDSDELSPRAAFDLVCKLQAKLK